MILYYVEQKGFYLDSQGRDRQLADGGQHPILYHSLEKAIRRANHMIDLWVDTYEMQVTIDNDNYRSKSKDLLFATRLEDRKNGIRYEIRVYEIETRD